MPHHVTAMVVQAEAARYLTAQRLDQSLTTVADTGRPAITDLRHLLDVLNPDHGSLRTLVERTRQVSYFLFREYKAMYVVSVPRFGGAEVAVQVRAAGVGLAEDAQLVALCSLARVRVRPTVDGHGAVRSPATPVPALVDHLGIHAGRRSRCGMRRHDRVELAHLRILQERRELVDCEGKRWPFVPRCAGVLYEAEEVRREGAALPRNRFDAVVAKARDLGNLP